jgi:hypothetical protein
MEIKNKKGWLRIVEAFIAVLMVLGVILVIISKQNSEASRADEITKLQRQILDYVSRDEGLRAEVLSNNTSGVDQLVNRTIPTWIAYNVSICNPDAICTIDFYGKNITQEVYTNEILVVANLTTYNAKKLKLFFWEK